MKTWQIILGILMFALVTAILYIWGLKKSMGQKDELPRNLLHACGSKVVKYLKKHDTITTAEIAELIEGTTVHQVWSQNRLTVKIGKDYAPELIRFLLDQQYIQPAGRDSYRIRR